MPPSVMLQYE